MLPPVFFLDCLLIQAEHARGLLEKEDPVKLLSESQKEIYDLFNTREELSVSDIHDKTGIPLQAVKQAVSRLCDHTLLERLGQGSATRYRLHQ